MAISASELTSIQADLASVCLDKDCEIQRNTKGQDGYGHETEGYTHLSNCKAGLAQPGASLLQNYDYRVGALDISHVKFAYGQDVKRGDHVIIEGNTLEVHVLLEPHTVPGLTSVLAAALV